MKINKVCERCGSEDIVVSARAYWSVTKQQWEMRDVWPDEAWCEDCDDMTTLKEEQEVE